MEQKINTVATTLLLITVALEIMYIKKCDKFGDETKNSELGSLTWQNAFKKWKESLLHLKMLMFIHLLILITYTRLIWKFL